MFLNKRRSIIFQSLFLILPIFFYNCRKSEHPLFLEYTYSINKNTVFIQLFPPDLNNNRKNEIAIIVFVEEDENVDEYRSILNDFYNDGYKLVFLKADWVSILLEYSSLPLKDESKNLICDMLKGELNQDKKIFLITGELGCFSLEQAIQSDCSDGLILLSPYCNSDDFRENNNQLSLYIPTFISVGENDTKAYNFSLQLYQKNRSFCEMRTYPTDEASWALLNSSTHIKEQIRLWIKTITSKAS